MEPPGRRLAPDSLLRLTPSEVAVEQASRNLGDPEKTGDPEGQIRSRLETLRTVLSGKCDDLRRTGVFPPTLTTTAIFGRKCLELQHPVTSPTEIPPLTQTLTESQNP